MWMFLPSLSIDDVSMIEMMATGQKLLFRPGFVEAARLGLTGLGIVASHEIITARMERGAERILRLIEEGKQAEAVALMNTETWGIEEQGEPGEQETF